MILRIGARTAAGGILLCFIVVHAYSDRLGPQHMYDDDQNTYPLCPTTKEHTSIYFEADDKGRDVCGFPCVMHLSKGKTLAHAFDTHGHFSGVLIEEVACKRKFVGQDLSDWECEPKPPLPTALVFAYRVHCIHQLSDGSLPDFNDYYTHRYRYSMDLYSGGYNTAMLSNMLDYFVSSAKQHVASYNNWSSRDILSTTITVGSENPAYKSVPDDILPATFCGITYAIHSNHYYLGLLGISSAWTVFPFFTIVFAFVLVFVHSTHQKTFGDGGRGHRRMYAQLKTKNLSASPCSTFASICKLVCVTLMFCMINLFIYFASQAVLDIYSYADDYTATVTVVVQYVVWVLTSVIYLWSLPSYTVVMYNILPHEVRMGVKSIHGSVDPTLPWQDDAEAPLGEEAALSRKEAYVEPIDPENSRYVDEEPDCTKESGGLVEKISAALGDDEDKMD
jgi:hypothetical protein